MEDLIQSSIPRCSSEGWISTPRIFNNDYTVEEFWGLKSIQEENVQVREGWPGPLCLRHPFENVYYCIHVVPIMQLVCLCLKLRLANFANISGKISGEWFLMDLLKQTSTLSLQQDNVTAVPSSRHSMFATAASEKWESQKMETKNNVNISL